MQQRRRRRRHHQHKTSSTRTMHFQVVFITDLAPASWYDMSVSGYSEAGHSEAAYLVGTLTPDGRRLPPPPERIKETPRGPLQGMQVSSVSRISERASGQAIPSFVFGTVAFRSVPFRSFVLS